MIGLISLTAAVLVRSTSTSLLSGETSTMESWSSLSSSGSDSCSRVSSACSGSDELADDAAELVFDPSDADDVVKKWYVLTGGEVIIGLKTVDLKGDLALLGWGERKGFGERVGEVNGLFNRFGEVKW